MRRCLPVCAALLVAALLTGCQRHLCNDHLAHALYESPPVQSLVRFNDAISPQAINETRVAEKWCGAVDYLGAGLYYDLHAWLNRCD